MSRAQELHDRLKDLTEEFKGTPGLSYPLAALGGILGHLKAEAKREAVAPVPATEAEPAIPAPAPPAARPVPVVQVARPKPQVE